MKHSAEKLITEMGATKATGRAALAFADIRGMVNEGSIFMYFMLYDDVPATPFIILQVFDDAFNKKITLPSPGVICLVRYGETWEPEEGTIRCEWDNGALRATGEFDVTCHRVGIPRMVGSFDVYLAKRA
ncbi:hypothetical protein [Pseudomonas fluorescens]|jgi:hypothetical protein|uniref:hypothetical protein n=1 Tax=Pseudomonas fluorescens TaxID=294 RepID=UPI0027834CB1|nr:hypothetical protein [Pseudomonas fluorescens]MDP9782658.1 hypothetical protein [Pseudomonas fluorescens]